MKKALLTAAIVLASTTLIAGTPQKIGLMIQPQRRLPGIPSSIILRFPSDVNPDTLHFAMWVDGPNGEGFFAKPFYFDTPTMRVQTDEPVEYTGRTLTFGIDATGATPEWFADARLNKPGVYTLRAVVTTTPLGMNAQFSDVAIDSSAMVSESTTMTVISPEGDDAEVWKRMCDVADGTWGGTNWVNDAYKIAREVWTRFPNSDYAPFFALKVPADAASERAEIAAAALRRYPNHPLSDWYRVLGGRALALSIPDAEKKRINRSPSDIRREATDLMKQVLGSDSAPGSLKRMAQQFLEELGGDGDETTK